MVKIKAVLAYLLGVHLLILINAQQVENTTSNLNGSSSASDRSIRDIVLELDPYYSKESDEDSDYKIIFADGSITYDFNSNEKPYIVNEKHSMTKLMFRGVPNAVSKINLTLELQNPVKEEVPNPTRMLKNNNQDSDETEEAEESKETEESEESEETEKTEETVKPARNRSGRGNRSSGRGNRSSGRGNRSSGSKKNESDNVAKLEKEDTEEVAEADVEEDEMLDEDDVDLYEVKLGIELVEDPQDLFDTSVPLDFEAKASYVFEDIDDEGSSVIIAYKCGENQVMHFKGTFFDVNNSNVTYTFYFQKICGTSQAISRDDLFVEVLAEDKIIRNELLSKLADYNNTIIIGEIRNFQLFLRVTEGNQFLLSPKYVYPENAIKVDVQNDIHGTVLYANERDYNVLFKITCLQVIDKAYVDYSVDLHSFVRPHIRFEISCKAVDDHPVPNVKIVSAFANQVVVENGIALQNYSNGGNGSAGNNTYIQVIDELEDVSAYEITANFPQTALTITNFAITPIDKNITVMNPEVTWSHRSRKMAINAKARYFDVLYHCQKPGMAKMKVSLNFEKFQSVEFYFIKKCSGPQPMDSESWGWLKYIMVIIALAFGVYVTQLFRRLMTKEKSTQLKMEYAEVKQKETELAKTIPETTAEFEKNELITQIDDVTQIDIANAAT
jgi:hypothetical protein